MKLTVELGSGTKVTYCSESDDLTTDEVLFNFCHLMVGAGFQPKSIVSALETVTEELACGW